MLKKTSTLLTVLGLVAALSVSGCKSMEKIGTFNAEAEPLSASIHIKRIAYSSDEESTIVKIFGNRKFGYTSYKLSDPLRLAVEIPDVQLDFEPKRIKVDERNISYISVVRFPRVNSVRIEMELNADVPFTINQRSDHLEISLSNQALVVAATSRVAQSRSRQVGMLGGSEKNRFEETIEQLEAENGKLKLVNQEAEQFAKRLEEENRQLKLQVQEAGTQLKETGGMTQTLEARIAFMEEKLSKLQSRITAPSILPLTVETALPAPSTAVEDITSAMQDNGAETIKQMIESWLGAWNRKDMLAYSSFYSPDFKTVEVDREIWLDDKKIKFERPGNIEITIGNPDITINDTGAVVVLEQTFKSDSYQDQGTKTLSLIQTDGEWYIISETWEPL